MTLAQRTLSEKTGLSPCKDNSCSLHGTTPFEKSSSLQYPNVHYHLHAVPTQTIQLYNWDKRLWKITTVEDQLNDAADQDIIYAHDARIPIHGGSVGMDEGRFPTNLPPVQIPTLERLFEALMLLEIMDNDHTPFWSQELRLLRGSPTTMRMLNLEHLNEPYRGLMKYKTSEGATLVEYFAKAEVALKDHVHPISETSLN
ncbi:hypothetical protein MMC09_006964 [Bachmanniomyces sp. S44760]|nr:hypothetical protein [Bachmanniomyces sp. S44760]